MIHEKLNPVSKLYLARGGDARFFGEDSEGRRKMSEPLALQLFAEIWKSTFEPEIGKAAAISAAEARELLDGKPRAYAIEGYQFRQFSLHSVVFIARLNRAATEDGECDQLWSLGASVAAHRDNTRLCIHFETVADRERFEFIAEQLNKEPRKLALSLAADFMHKFPESF